MRVLEGKESFFGREQEVKKTDSSAISAAFLGGLCV
jgi:hypothetical protein